MIIGITGAAGLLGNHARNFFRGQAGFDVRAGNRDIFSSPSALKNFVEGLDVILHFAGMNRGPDDVVSATNVELSRQLADAISGIKTKPHIFFAASTHIYKGTPYGESKKACAEIFSSHPNACFTNLILPHVFGEGGKPFYNSAISTFCHQLATGEEPRIENDAELELVHAQQVASCIFKELQEKTFGDLRVHGVKMRVSEALSRLQKFHTGYSNLIIPDVRNAIDLHLFNTYRSYLYPKHYPVSLKLHSDPRGHLFEAVKSENGGQSFISTTRPGITRGNHYHLSKIERFCVLSGKAEIRIRKMFTSDVLTFEVNGEHPQFIDIPTLHTHNITNTGNDPLVTLFWSHEIFDPMKPDTIREEV
jgi:UDP-2-acetamido-2,6-beta-L-arabino-hexul-4-ose reductase